MKKYTHFAIYKPTGKIVNGWNYNGYDPEDLRQFKKDYFINDLIDMRIDPKKITILTKKGCNVKGINPMDNNNWQNYPFNENKNTNKILTENNQLGDYETWRRDVEEEVMWFSYSNKKPIWKIKGKVIIDGNRHALNHCGYKLLTQTLNKVDFSKEVNGFIEQEVYFNYPVGYCECVPTNEKDEIVYLQRNNRMNVSRFVLNRQPELCNSVFIVLKNKIGTNVYYLKTAYVGTKSGKEPWDKTSIDSDVEFWKNHALIAPNETNKYDDMGEGSYWTKMEDNNHNKIQNEIMNKKNVIRINETQLKQIISESVKNALNEIELNDLEIVMNDSNYWVGMLESQFKEWEKVTEILCKLLQKRYGWRKTDYTEPDENTQGTKLSREVYALKDKVKSFIDKKSNQYISLSQGVDDRYIERFGGREYDMLKKFHKYYDTYGEDNLDNENWRKENLTPQEQDYFDYSDNKTYWQDTL